MHAHGTKSSISGDSKLRTIQPMGSARSPSSPSSSDPSYTHRAHHSAGHYKDENKEGSTDQKLNDDGVSWESASGSLGKRRKKKNKKERHGYQEFAHDPQQGRVGEPSTTLPVAEKLPPIKISLRLPPLSLAAASSDKASHGVDTSKKKRRISETLEVGMDECEDWDHGRERRSFSRDSQDITIETSTHKKKKKKHKHKHRHPNHGDIDETSNVHHHSGHLPGSLSTLSADYRLGQGEVPELRHRHPSEPTEDVNPPQAVDPPQISETEQENNDDFEREETEQTEVSHTLGVDSREHSVKPTKKLKSQKRVLTPKLITPAIPKKKELSVACHKLLDSFIRRDSYVLFSHPVDPALVPDYSSVIKNPMDFSTMRAKVERGFYPDIEEFLADFKLVCDNARLYNSRETLYWKQADKLWDWGSKVIERDRKTIIDREEDILTVVKDEENLDVVGIGEHSLTHLHVVTPLSGRAAMTNVEVSLDSPMSAVADQGRLHTPQQYRKSKKIKHRRDGTIAFSYSTDGSIDPASHPDPWSLVPVGASFGSAPTLSNIISGASPYYGQLLDDYPYWKIPSTTAIRAAAALDYGTFSSINPVESNANNQAGIQNISAYTGMVFGDEQGESYVRSLVMFLEGVTDGSGLSKSDEQHCTGLLQVQDYIRENIERLTRGASSIADKVAIVIRDEVQEPDGANTHIPLALWNQEFKTMEAERIKPDLSVAETDVSKTGGSVVEGKKRRGSTSQERGFHVIGNAGAKSLPSPPTIQQEYEQSDMVDIRQVIQGIRSWPDLQRKKSDYSLWRKFLIELDSLLSCPSSLTATSTATDATETLDESKPLAVRWGDRWTEGDSDESCKWVREYLELNSQEMRELAGILTTESKSDHTIDPTYLKLMGNIRRRLIEMVQYVPLSEVNSQKLPRPISK